jgi:hypothetical protein
MAGGSSVTALKKLTAVISGFLPYSTSALGLPHLNSIKLNITLFYTGKEEIYVLTTK